MNDLAISLVWLGFFAAVFFGWYYFLQARNKERMALIERDKDVSEIYSKQEFKFRFPWLKLGMLIAGIGLGLGIMAIVVLNMAGPNGLSEDQEGILYTTGAMFFGGMGIVIAYFLEKPGK